MLEAFRRHEEQRADRERRVGVEVQPVERRLGVVADVFVKLLVFRRRVISLLFFVQSACTVFTALPFSSIGNGTKFE